MATDKSRYWTFIVYEDSCPDYLERIKDTHVSACISPWHDRDLNPTGEKKKKHRHVLVCWDGPTTEKNVQKQFGGIAANGVIQCVASARGMFRYLTHKDNPEKAQYDEADLIQVNGFDPCNILSETDKNNLAWDATQLIILMDFREYGEFCSYLVQEGARDMYNVVIHNSGHFTSFIRSRRYAIEMQEKKKKEDCQLDQKMKALEAKKQKILDDNSNK